MLLRPRSPGLSDDESGPPPPALAPAVELFSCQELWPDGGADPAFQSILDAARPALVAFFRDALAVLNAPPLRDAFLGLSPEGVAALLEADEFGTDDESSVLLALATWMQVSPHGGAQADRPQQGCVASCARTSVPTRPQSPLRG